jgi:hypothetical protein
MRFLTKVVPLQHPSPQAELFLATDASDSQIGGINSKNPVTIGVPLVSFSEICPTWNLIISHNQELLAAYASIQHFSHFFEGRLYQLWTLSAWLAMSSQAFFNQWSLKSSEKTFFSPAQHFPPQEAYLWAACLFLDMSGAVLPGCGSLCLDLPALQSKIHRHARTQPLHIPIPQWQFSHLHVDLVGRCNNTVTIAMRCTPCYLYSQQSCLYTVYSAIYSIINQNGHLLTPLATVRPVGCTPITLYCTCI